MEPHRLRAPSSDGGVLAEPPLSEAGSVLAGNLELLRGWDHDFQGRHAGRLRAMARQQILAASKNHHERFGLDLPAEPGPSSPLIVTGHQPELFHPGVWIKNFATASLAIENQGAGLNLIVDNDTPRWASIRVPIRNDGILRTSSVDFDDWTQEIPYEDWTVTNEAKFATFADRVREALQDQVDDPLLDEFWPLVRESVKETNRAGLRFAAGRRRLEGQWGVHNWCVPLSAVCETEAFLWFASHLLAQLPRFQNVHNNALRRYRQLYHIRSKNHPVPSLAVEDDWLEAPFWVWRASDPRRRPLLARQLGRTMELRIAGENAPFVEIPLTADREACCAVDRLRDLPTRGIRLRTRALTTTMFARFLLGDLFLHGIGGAKYDELGDEIARTFFGIKPPGYLTLSMTLWLGLPDDPSASSRLHEVERLIRDLTYNPDQHLPDALSPDWRSWVEAKQAAIGAPQATRRERVARFHAIQRCNAALRSAVQSRIEAATTERNQLRSILSQNAVARSREYSFVLHSRSRFRGAIAGVLPSLSLR